MDIRPKMNKNVFTIIEVDGLTGATNVRELTDDEIKDYKKILERQEKTNLELLAKEAAKASALAKLAALGLTQEEIESL